MTSDTLRLKRWLIVCTVAFVLIYAPLETIVTVEIAGLSGLRYGGYLMEGPGLGMMVLGAVSRHKREPFGAGLLAVGWGWMAATFWRATSDRFRFADLYGGRSGNYWGAGKGGNAELVIACGVTALACLGVVAALRLLYLQTKSLPAASR